MRLTTRRGASTFSTHGRSPGMSWFSMACCLRRIVQWQAQGVDVDQAMLSLSTYVGHAAVSNTYWYLSAVPELMAVAAGRFASFVKPTEVPHA